MKVKCITSQTELYFWGLWLTSGKNYDVVKSSQENMVWVVDDAGKNEFLEEGMWEVVE